MSRKAPSQLVCAVLLAIFSSLSLYAQMSVGTILGTVKDPTDAVIPNATVTIRNVGTNAARTIKTGADGSYLVPELPAGNYEVKASHDGFETVVHQNIVLTVEQQAVVNFALPVGSTQQVVQVTTALALVNTTDNTIAGLVGEQSMESLPLNGRNYVDLALMEPGTSQDYALAGNSGSSASGGAAFSNHGSTPFSNVFTLDGAYINNGLGLNSASQTANTLGVEGIQEFKIVGIPDASYGMGMGGQIVMGSKGGTNQFHGDIFDFLRNSIFDARNYYDYTYKYDPPYRISHFDRNQYGGAFGGPIKKDKTFFYGVYEALNSAQGGAATGAPVIDTVPAAGCFGGAGAVIWNGAGAQPAGSTGNCPQLGGTTASTVTIASYMAPLLALYPSSGPNLPNSQYTYATNTTVTESFGQIRVDHTLSEKDSLFARYTIDNGVAIIPESFSQFRQANPGANQYLTLAENHVFSPSVVNAFRISGSRTSQNVYNILIGGTYTGPQYSFVNGLLMGSWSISGGFTGSGPSTSAPRYLYQDVYTVVDDVSLNKGKHTLKYGALVNIFRTAVAGNIKASGVLSFSSLANFLQGTIANVQVTTLPAGLTPKNGQPAVSEYFGYSTFGFYIQDAWRAAPRLTLNGGVRYEAADTVNSLNGQGYALRNVATDAAVTQGPIMMNPTLKNFEPRAGFAYDIFGNGKTSLRGGWGIYRDVGNLGGVLREYIQGTPPYALTTITSPTVTGFPLNLTGGAVGKSLQTVDYQQKAPYEMQYNLTIERQLFGLGISATYVGLHGIHLWSRYDGNPVTPAGYLANGEPYYSNASSQPACVINGVTTGGTTTFCRTNPNWSVISLNGTNATSLYNAGELNVVRPASHGVEFQSSLTWSKSLDDTESMGGFENNAVACYQGDDPLDRRTDRGPSCFDTPLKWNVNLTYRLPKFSGSSFVKTLANGWTTSDIVTIQSGSPFTPVLATSTNRSNNGVFLQSDYVDHVNVNTVASIANWQANCTSLPGQPAAGATPCQYTPIPYDKKTVATHNPAQWFNPAMFSLGPVGYLGTAGRDILRSPYLLVWNTTVVKDTPVRFLGEGGSVQFRAELFNPINKSNFGIPNQSVFTGSQKDTGPYSELPTSTAGQITSTFTSSRQAQFALKLIF